MASRPAHLKPVPDSVALTLVQLAEAMSDLRQKIADLFDDAQTVTIGLGKDMASFEIAIYLAPLADPARTEFILSMSPLKHEGIVFSNITTKVLERSCRRRVVSALIAAGAPS